MFPELIISCAHHAVHMSLQRARSALLLMNCIAIVGYAAFPLMPPRLVPDCATRYSGCDRDYTFVDSMDTLGGLWSWRGSALEGVRVRGKQYVSKECLCLCPSLPCRKACFTA